MTLLMRGTLQPVERRRSSMVETQPSQFDEAGTPRLSVGARLGPYRIKSFIGAGGMGEVYEARDTNLDRTVALKLLPASVASDPERLDRFEQEARTVSALSHPAIVTIYDAGEVDSQPFISMELVGGQTLREQLEAGALPLRRGLRIASRLADGLAAAHEAGLVHRDLKPENIKIANDGFVKILDFGLAKRVSSALTLDAVGEAATAIQTIPGMVVGTAGYMSPEQASAVPVDFTSDQFSFGAVLYEILTGRRAFERPTFAETLRAIIREEPVRISEINPGVPAPVRWIVERCLAKDPRERYALTRDLSRDLTSVREHLTEILAGRRDSHAARTDRDRSILVLPVVNVSGKPAHDAAADAMTTELIAALTRRGSLRVLSRTASLTYKGRCSPLPEIAEELEVRWILDVTMMHAGRQVRVTAQLVDGITNENHWAEGYTRQARGILSVQSEIATAIAASVDAVTAARAPQPDASHRRRGGTTDAALRDL
jgi:serine/threonine protein kinase